MKRGVLILLTVPLSTSLTHPSTEEPQFKRFHVKDCHLKYRNQLTAYSHRAARAPSDFCKASLLWRNVWA